MRATRLISPEGSAARPTHDRVREAVFGSLQLEIPDSRVLDLFAGSGAMGLEALSRGARFSHFVDASCACARIIRQNVEKLRVIGQARVSCTDFRRAVAECAQRNEVYDMIVLDPPYRSGLIEQAIQCILQGGCAGPGAIWIVEHASDEPCPVVAPLSIMRQKRYSHTMVTFLKAT